ncbi:hypothetical protein Scep_007701 [Stephania cephalantha]|uniref:Uncharacterized protein n=1 Tax=Stephania cephalantha TaxID=152367 RepID=A0AAP0PNI0_9MAGN
MRTRWRGRERRMCRGWCKGNRRTYGEREAAWQRCVSHNQRGFCTCGRTYKSIHTSSSLQPNSTFPYSPKPKDNPLCASILFIAVAIIGAVVFFALLFANTPDNLFGRFIREGRWRPHKLKKPVVIMISADGFLFGYQFKTPTPNIHRLTSKGTEADREA